jgi:hypothetical protein
VYAFLVTCLAITANRAINGALFESELYDSLKTNGQQQRQIRLPSNPSNHVQQLARPINTNPSDILMPSSYLYEPGSVVHQSNSEEQHFQRPSLNNLGQNYLPNSRLQQSQQQRDVITHSTYAPISSPPQRSIYAVHQSTHEQKSIPVSHPTNIDSYTRMPIQQQYAGSVARQQYASDNRDMFLANHMESQPAEPSAQPVPMSVPPPPPPPAHIHQQDDPHKRQGNISIGPCQSLKCVVLSLSSCMGRFATS